MKKLNMLFDTNYETVVRDIKINSKEIKKGDMFVCISGIHTDRHDFIDEAIARGASCIVGSKDIVCSVPYIKVDSPDAILVKLCKDFYDYKEGELKIIGVTGTDGKTTVATSIQTLIGKHRCGYIGTNGCTCSAFIQDSPNSTPDPTVLYKFFKEFREAGCEYVVMEASSEGFFRNRLDGLLFDAGCYTNITWEHVNIHGSFENYVDCKVQLARQTKNSFAYNMDDKYYDCFKKEATSPLSYGKEEKCDLYIKNFKISPKYTDITYVYQEKEYTFISPLLGEFNVYNLAAAMLTCLSLGFDICDLLENVINIKVAGRQEIVDLGQDFTVMVDYAHTPNGIENLLKFVRVLNVNRAIVVMGSAGERDYVKRPVMGKTVYDSADYAIFTYEDPRSEDPYEIIKQIVSDIPDESSYEIVVDRSMAIKRAIDIASKNDIVLILGKGNETYEKLRDQTIYFNDIEEARRWLAERLEREEVIE